MDGELLNRLADQAAARYALLLEGFNATLLSVLPFMPWSDKARASLTGTCYKLANAFLGDAPSLIDQELHLVAELAAAATATSLGVLSATLNEDVEQHLTQLASNLESSLRIQIERDIATSIGMLRQMALRETVSARSRGVSVQGVQGSRNPVQGSVGAARFDFLDRAGRRWPSQKYIRTIWRQALMVAWNETALLIIADHGLAQAVVAHPDPKSTSIGILIALTDQAAGANWIELDDIFHPNTSSYVMPLMETS